MRIFRSPVMAPVGQAVMQAEHVSGQGSSSDGDGVHETFLSVTGGTLLRFRFTVENTIVPATGEVQLFVVTIRLIGDALTVLAEHRLFIEVPDTTKERKVDLGPPPTFTEGLRTWWKSRS